MDKVMLTMLMPVILAGAIFLIAATSHNPRTAKRATLLIFGLLAAMWLFGCAKPENDGDVAVIIAEQGTVIETEMLDNKHCKVLIINNKGLSFGIIKKDLKPCEEFKEGDKVIFTIILQPSQIRSGNIQKL